MKRKLSLLLFVLSFSMIIPSCIKDEVTPLTNEGATFVKFLEGPEQKFFFSPFTDVKEVHIFSFRRDANSSASLQTAADVTVQLNDDLIVDYNTEHETEFESLPANMYSIVADQGVVQNGDQFNIHFNPGEYSKNLKVLVNGAMWEDLGVSYALAFEVVDAGDLSVTDGKGSIISFLSIKNKYDGVYEVSGNLVDALGTRTGKYPKTVELRTTSPNTVAVYDTYWGTYQYIYGAFTDSNPRAAYYLGFEFNTNTDDVTDVYSAFSSFGLDLDDSYDNYYDADAKTIYVKWKTGTNTSGFPLGRFTITETYTYKGERE